MLRRGKNAPFSKRKFVDFPYIHVCAFFPQIYVVDIIRLPALFGQHLASNVVMHVSQRTKCHFKWWEKEVSVMSCMSVTTLVDSWMGHIHQNWIFHETGLGRTQAIPTCDSLCYFLLQEDCIKGRVIVIVLSKTKSKKINQNFWPILDFCNWFFYATAFESCLHHQPCLRSWLVSLHENFNKPSFQQTSLHFSHSLVTKIFHLRYPDKSK